MRRTLAHATLHRLLSLALMGMVLLALAAPSLNGQNRVAAQDAPPDAWTPPVNLSNSGSASDPIILVDADDISHVIWYDDFAGYRYTQTDTDPETPGDWTAPVSVILPFGEARPRLVMGSNDLVYAFWIDPERDTLNTSRVLSRNMGSGGSWEPRRQLALYPLAFDVQVDEAGNIHLVYLTDTDSETQPAGVYYSQGLLGGGWTDAQQIYTSLYFRGMDQQDARASVAAGAADPTSGARTVYVAWDDPALGKVLTRRSNDSGATWETTLEVDPINAVSGTARRFDLEVTAWKDQALLLWKKMLSETSCEIRYQVSSGEDWSAPGNVITGATGCPTSSSFAAQRTDVLVWQAEINNQVVLLAWDGSRWSQPQVQTELSGVKDPVTGRALALGCRSLFFQTADNSLHAAGCDLDGSRDIWVMEKMLGDLNSWFPPASDWNAPAVVSQSLREIAALNLVADSQGNFHALWAQPAQPAQGEQLALNASDVVHYSGWSAGSWSEPSPILGQRGGNPNELAAAIDAEDNLLVIWRGEQACQIFFSRAPAARGFSSLEWMEPVALPSAQGTCSTPALAAGAQSTVYAAYAVAINEGRGIYIQRSQDGGRSWEAPVRVFDAQAAQWEMVDHPVLAARGERLHLLWRHGSLHRAGEAQAIGYAYSDDGGATWSAARTIAGRLRWAGLAEAGNNLLLVWQQTGADQPVFVTQVSTDGGASWAAPVSIASFGEILGSPSLVTGADGSAHLIHATRDYLGKVFLRHWFWQNGGWAAGNTLDLTEDLDGALFALAGAVSSQQIGVLFAEDSPAIPGAAANGPLLQGVTGAAGLNSENAEALPVTQPVQESAAETSAVEPPAAETEAAVAIAQPAQPTAAATEPGAAAATVSATGEPAQQPSATPTQPAAGQNDTQEPASPNTWTGLILGVVLAVVIIIGVFGFRIAQTKA